MSVASVQTISEHSGLPQVVSGCQNVQREMPWLCSVAQPIDAPRSAIAMCATALDAFKASLASKRFSHRKYAKLIGVSHNTIGKWFRGEMPIALEWVDQICAVTGTRLLRQWIEFQKALDDAHGKDSEARRIERIARELAA